MENATLCSGFIKAEKAIWLHLQFFVWLWVVTPSCQHYSFLLLGRAVIVLGLVNTKPLKNMKLIPLVFFCEDYSKTECRERGKTAAQHRKQWLLSPSVFQMTLIKMTYNDNFVCGGAYLQKKM